MKILWFTNTPSLYDQGHHHYHGGGWIESLEELVRDQKGIDLAVSFFHKFDKEKIVKNRTTYFPILRNPKIINPFKVIINNWRGRFEDHVFDNKFLKIINDFKPDVIHVFGTEGPFSKIQMLTKVPVVIHVQGVLNPCLNSYYPVNQSDWSFVFNTSYLFNNLIGNSPNFEKKRFSTKAKREQDFLSNAKFIMGRTNWDKMLAKLYNPNVQYFHIDEVLRPVFYQIEFISKQHPDKRFKIISTLSPTIYKGIDVILKTARQLKKLTNIDFQWEIIGLEKSSKLLKHFESTEKIMHQDVNIICRGRKKPEEMIELMQSTDVFVHPSYIDNSPNSVCEAQMLGLSVIACDVGGISTLVQDGETGFLIPSNGVFELTHYLIMLEGDKNLRKKIGQKAKHIALQRHNRDKIVADLLKVYSNLSR
ncbi:glycosyltransferase family 4 protein [Algoriphagus sp.]|uniref:glycosyltransferase family 4 protein n=1 Tax=Algoriphagus sp. TaxID=1872435 RepID=UPI00391C4F1B